LCALRAITAIRAITPVRAIANGSHFLTVHDQHRPARGALLRRCIPRHDLRLCGIAASASAQDHQSNEPEYLLHTRPFAVPLSRVNGRRRSAG